MAGGFGDGVPATVVVREMDSIDSWGRVSVEMGRREGDLGEVGEERTAVASPSSGLDVKAIVQGF